MVQFQSDFVSDLFVEFEIDDPVRLRALEALVAAVKQAKDPAYQIDLDGADYEQYLDSGARAWFEASEDAGGWSFDSAIYVIGGCDYELLGVRRLSARSARVEVTTGGGPYGGLDSLKAVVEAFGHQVTEVRD